MAGWQLPGRSIAHKIRGTRRTAILIRTAIAFRDAGPGVRDLTDPPPGFREAVPEGIRTDIQAGADLQLPLPGENETGTAAAAGQPAFLTGMGGTAGLGERREGNLLIQGKTLQLRMQTEKAGIELIREIRRLPGTPGLIRRRKEGGADIDILREGMGQAERIEDILAEEAVRGHGNRKGKAGFPDAAEIFHHTAEDPAAGDPLIRILRAAIEGGLDEGGRMIPEEGEAPLSEEDGVGHDGDIAAKGLQKEKEIFEAGICEALPAGERRLEHAGIKGLAHEILPGIDRKKIPALELLRRKADIAHAAGEIAEGRKLKGTEERGIALTGLQIEAADKILIIHASQMRDKDGSDYSGPVMLSIAEEDGKCPEKCLKGKEQFWLKKTNGYDNMK